MNQAITLSGVALISAGVIPTPDDVTVLSPLLQIGLGSVLLIIGLMAKEK